MCVLADGSASEVLVALMVPVGAVAEGPNEHGVAHYLEHLVFRDRTVESGEPTSGAVGIDRYGNAYTTPFATTYHWTVPPERAGEAIERAIAVLGPLDLSPTVAEQERAVVQREREQRFADPFAKRAGAIEAALYAGTPLERSLIGTPDEIEALTAEAALAFHAAHYVPADALLVVAGAVDHLAVASAVLRGRSAAGIDASSANANGSDATASVPGPRTSANEPGTVGGGAAGARAIVARIVASPHAPDHLVVSGPFGAPERTGDALVRTTPDAATVAATDLIAAFLGSGLSGSPRVALEEGSERVPDAVADDVREALFDVRELVPGLSFVGVTLKLRPSVEADRREATLADAWEAWEAEWDALRRSGIPPDAFERLHARVVTDLERQRDDVVASAWSLIGWLEAGSDPSEWAAHPSVVAALTPERIDAVLRALDEPVRSVVTDALPTSAPFAIQRASPFDTGSDRSSTARSRSAIDPSTDDVVVTRTD